MRRFGVGFGAVVALAVWGAGAGAADVSRLIQSLKTDPAFKVRLQAARILQRRLELDPPPDPIGVAALADAARSDPHPVVRAFAVRALGQVGGASASATLEHAAAVDPDPMVREQAARAVAAWRARRAAAPVIVWSVDPWRLDDGEDWTPALSAALRSGLEQQADGRFRLAPQSDDRGFSIRATVSALDTEPVEGGDRLTLELRVAVSTWPARNLRQLITARASARVPSTHRPRDRLRRRLLDDAMKRALADALGTIEGG